ncbi:MAG: hypothetical protein A2W85_12455 [Bacteroidetes bacterium GWF2_41_31]|nr:MAG: hypothetical protein A2W85_12455 [Bacteroidetes bacterium GWF2_41_31]
MKTDQLEKFILDHREEFDVMEPSPEIWNKISAPKPVSSGMHISWKKVMYRVAAVIVIFIGSYYVHELINPPAKGISAIQSSASEEDRQMLTQLMESKAYYTSLIDTKTEEVYLLAAEKPMLRDEIQQEMKDLDREFLELQNDLHDNTDSEEVIAAMIQNYRLKLQILEETLMQLQVQKKENNIRHENKSVSI